MSVKFNIDYTKNLTKFDVTGVTTFQELTGLLNPYLAAGSTKFRVFDISRGELKGLRSRLLDQIIEWIRKNNDKRPVGTKSAFIVSEDAGYETLNLFHLLAEIKTKTWDARIFNSQVEAYEWLEMPTYGSHGKKSE